MRAATLIVMLALASYASAAIVDCSTLTGTFTNGAKCTSTAITVNGNAIAANSIVTCTTGFYAQVNNAGTGTSCVAVGNGCTQNAPNKAGANAAASTTPTSNTCVKGQVTPTATDGTDSFTSVTAAAADAVCNNPATFTATSTYYTPGALQTATGAPFSATPQNSWICLACPAGCMDCTPATGKAVSPAAATQNGCKTAGTGFYVNGGTTADATSGLFAIASCPSALNATYGNNATAGSCTSCNPVVAGTQTYGNCTGVSATGCAAGNTYISIANTTGMGNQTIGGKTVNVGALPYTSSGPYIGCYSVDSIIALIPTSSNSSNSSSNSSGNGSTTSATRITAGVAVASVVAAVFAF